MLKNIGVLKMDEFRKACREQDDMIDRRAAENVRSGMAPWDAYAKAAESVREHRRLRGVFDEAIREAQQTIREMDAAIEIAVKR